MTIDQELAALSELRGKLEFRNFESLQIQSKQQQLLKLEPIEFYYDKNNLQSDSEVNDETIKETNQDKLQELRDFCVQHEMPLPIIECVEKCLRNQNEPIFTVCCSVATIKRVKSSKDKNLACQKAAYEMLQLLRNDLTGIEPELESLVTEPLCAVQQERGTKLVDEQLEEERRKTFQTYRQLKANDVKSYGVRICDRHNYFKFYYPHLKMAAIEILYADDVDETPKERALKVLSALKLKPNIIEQSPNTPQALLFIELNCNYDCVFAGAETDVYNDIITYFKEMLI